MTCLKPIFIPEQYSFYSKIECFAKNMGWMPRLKNQIGRFNGLICGSAAGIFYSVANALVQSIYHSNEELDLSECQIIIVYSLVQFILNIMLLVWKRINPFGDTWSVSGLLWLMGLARSCIFIFFIQSVINLPLGDATVIMFTSPVFTNILSIVLLREPCSIWNLVFGMFSLLGVAIVVAPEKFFSLNRSPAPYSYLQVSTNQTETPLKPHQITADYEKGVAFGIAAAFLSSIYMILMKINTKNIDYRAFFLCPSLLGIVIPTIHMLIEKHKVVMLSYDYWILNVAAGFSYFIGMMLIAYALFLEDAGQIALTRYSEVLFAFIFQIVIEKQIPMLFSTVGVVLIIWSASMIMLNRIYNIEEKIYKKFPDCPSCRTKKDKEEDLPDYELVSNDCEHNEK